MHTQNPEYLPDVTSEHPALSNNDEAPEPLAWDSHTPDEPQVLHHQHEIVKSPTQLVVLCVVICILCGLPLLFVSAYAAAATSIAVGGVFVAFWNHVLAFWRPHCWKKALLSQGFSIENRSFVRDDLGDLSLSISRGFHGQITLRSETWSERFELRLRGEEDDGLGVESGDRAFDERFVLEGNLDILYAMLTRDVRTLLRHFAEISDAAFGGGYFAAPLVSFTESLEPSEITSVLERLLDFAKSTRLPLDESLNAIANRALSDDPKPAAAALLYLEERHPSNPCTIATKKAVFEGPRGDLRLAYAEAHPEETEQRLIAMIKDESLDAGNRALALFAQARHDLNTPSTISHDLAQSLVHSEIPQLCDAALRVLTIRRSVAENVLLHWIANRFLLNDTSRLPECVRPIWFEEAKKAGRKTIERCLQSASAEGQSLARYALNRLDAQKD